MLCKYLLILIVIIVGLAGKFQMLNIKKIASYLFFFSVSHIYFIYIHKDFAKNEETGGREKEKQSN